MRQNAPPKFLEEECAKNHKFVLRQAAVTPRVRISKVETEAVGDGVQIVRVTVENEGYLPTNISDKAVRLGVAKPVTANWRARAAILMGEPKQTLGHLEGRAQAVGAAFWGPGVLKNEARAEWLVRGTGTATLTVKSEKGGTTAREIALGQNS